jgi:hypothetical protein
MDPCIALCVGFVVPSPIRSYYHCSRLYEGPAPVYVGILFFFFDLPRFCFLFFSYFLFFLILYFLFFSSYFLFYSLLFSPLPVIIGDFSPSIYSYHLLSVPFYALSFSTYSPFLSFFFGLFCVILFFSCSI